MKLSDLETARICRGLSLLLHGGIFLTDGVFYLEQEEQGRVKQVLATLGQFMDQGDSLSQAMEKSGIFPHQAAAMTDIGEKTGATEEVLLSLAQYYEDRYAARSQIRSALGYPLMVLALMLAVILVLLVKVLPIFDRVYASLGSGLTGAASWLLKLGQGLEALLPGILLAAVCLGAAIWVYTRWAPCRDRVDHALQRLLGDRGITRRFYNAQFSRALSLGLRSGLPLEESIAMAAQLMEDVPQAARRCRECLRLLQEGSLLTAAMAQTGLMPQAQSLLLSIGLRSGSPDRILEEVTQQLNQEARDHLEQTIGRIEPVMVTGCALLVGAILLTVMLPLAGILSAIG